MDGNAPELANTQYGWHSAGLTCTSVVTSSWYLASCRFGCYELLV